MRIMKSGEYEAFVAEGKVQQALIEDLKKENAALSRTASFYKSEAEKAQREIQKLNAELKKAANDLKSPKRYTDDITSGFTSQMIDLYSEIDQLEKKKDKLLRDIAKLKKKQVISSGENVAKPLINTVDIDFDVDMAIANAEKHREEVERLTEDYSQKIETLTENVADRDKTISVQKSKINQFELEIKVKNETIRKDKEDIEILESIYKDACDVVKYACRKLGRDFDRCLDMKIDNYRLSYIFGDERSR